MPDPSPPPGPVLAECRRRAALGAALLDSRSPGWAGAVEPGRLDMGSCRDCVLALRYGGFGAGHDALGLSREALRAHGFAAWGDAPFGWAELGRAWREQVERRKGVEG